MTAQPPLPVEDDPAAPVPRRTRRGAVVIGPTVGARWGPGALLGLPIVALLLSPFAGAGLDQWRRMRLLDGPQGWMEEILAHGWAQILIGAGLLWALFAVWALVPMLATHQVVLFDDRSGELRLRKGLRTLDTARLEDVVHAVGEAERGRIGRIGMVDGVRREHREWIVPEVGWDSASFDGLRALQEAAGLRTAPERQELVLEARRIRREAQHRELAARAGMPWRPEYAVDEAAFQQEFDRVRRVLGGKEPAQDGDPRP